MHASVRAHIHLYITGRSTQFPRTSSRTPSLASASSLSFYTTPPLRAARCVGAANSLSVVIASHSLEDMVAAAEAGLFIPFPSKIFYSGHTCPFPL